MLEAWELDEARPSLRYRLAIQFFQWVTNRCSSARNASSLGVCSLCPVTSARPLAAARRTSKSRILEG